MAGSLRSGPVPLSPPVALIMPLLTKLISELTQTGLIGPGFSLHIRNPPTGLQSCLEPECHSPGHGLPVYTVPGTVGA